MNPTTSTVTPISQNPKQPQQRQTAKDIIAANVKSLIEQLEAGHSDALTAYLDAMSRFHNYSSGNILEIARQRPSATRVAGLYAWNQLGRKVMKGQKGIRILAPIIGFKRKKDEEAEKDITKQNTRVLVGFRNAYVFDVAQTKGAELPAMREMRGTVGEHRDRLVSFIEAQGIELVFTEKIAPALGMSYGGRIAIFPGRAEAEEFSTLVHELAHEMLHKAERRTTTTKVVKETEAEAIAFVIGKAVGLDTGTASADYIHLYHGNASLLAESLEVIQQTSAVILAALQPPTAEQAAMPDAELRRWRDADHPSNPQDGRWVAPRPLPQDRKPALHGPCYRVGGRVRSDGISCTVCLSLRRTERRPHARPGDVLRAWTNRRGAPEPLPLPQRLHGCRAVEPEHHPRPLRALGRVAQPA